MWSHSQQWAPLFLSDLRLIVTSHQWTSVAFDWTTIDQRLPGTRGTGLGIWWGSDKPRKILQYSVMVVVISMLSRAGKHPRTWTWGAACLREKAGGQIKQRKKGRRRRQRSHLAQLATFYPCSPLVSSSTSKSPTSTRFQAITTHTRTHTNSYFSIHFHLLLQLFWSANRLVFIPWLFFSFLCPSGASTT